jgi:hypothetical protein
MPERKLPFPLISASDSNSNPRNTTSIPVANPAKAGSSSLILTKNPSFVPSLYVNAFKMHGARIMYLATGIVYYGSCIPYFFLNVSDICLVKTSTLFARSRGSDPVPQAGVIKV